VATNGELRIFALALGDSICATVDLGHSLSSGTRLGGGCQTRQELDENNGVIEIIDDVSTPALIVAGITAGTTTGVEVSLPDPRRGRTVHALAPAGGPNDVLDGQFYVAVLDGDRYVQVEGYDELDLLEIRDVALPG
jgi:hypothetical protein